MILFLLISTIKRKKKKRKKAFTQETRNQKPEIDFFNATPIGYWINLWQCQWPEGNYVQPRNI